MATVMKKTALVIEQLSCVSLPAEKPIIVDKASLRSRLSQREQRLEDVRKKYRFPWRINQLASPRLKKEKFVKPPDVYEGTVSPNVFKLQKCPSRSDHLARADVRKLRINKVLYSKKLGKKFTARVEKNLQYSWNSIYNYYKRCEKAFMERLKSQTSVKSKAKKSKEQLLKELAAWLALNALPKPLPPSDPLPPRKRAPLQQLMERGEILAIAKALPRQYMPPRIVPIPITEAAKNYTATERIATLAQLPKRYIELLDDPGPRKPGEVEKNALTAKATPRILEMAVPHVRTKAEDKDEKDDICAISPNALKYVATARIKELAKHVER